MKRLLLIDYNNEFTEHLIYEQLKQHIYDADKILIIFAINVKSYDDYIIADMLSNIKNKVDYIKIRLSNTDFNYYIKYIKEQNEVLDTLKEYSGYEIITNIKIDKPNQYQVEDENKMEGRKLCN